MKWTANFLPFGVLVASVSAGPIAKRQLDLYELQISCPANENLDGRFLSLQNNTLGVFDGNKVSPIQVYQIESEKEDCIELHTYPVGIVDHTLGLMGPPGLLALVDMTNPRTIDPGEGTVAQWDTFRITKGKLGNSIDGQWLAFPGQNDRWAVKWSDGSAVIIGNSMVINIIYKNINK
ncbi:hypothetical protein GGR53DRAFT_524550 [Hypoxylon sp. FL1150]|nr:hypothetical protein GGR53DRAFT_524550 [Hypoxylon sp. FL1150]